MGNSSARVERGIRVYNYIVEYKRANDGLFPTIREIVHACAINTTSLVVYTLRELEVLGLLKRDGKRRIVIGGRWDIE